eukprot:g3410.t1
MRAYSPPVTRQRARAIVLGEAGQKDQRGQQERQVQEQAQAQGEQGSNSARVRRRDRRQQKQQQQQQQQQSAPEELKPAATLGNSVGRWRRRGGGRKNPGVGEEGGRAGAGGGGSSKVAVAVAASGPGHAGEESASRGGDGGSVPPSSAALSSLSASGEPTAPAGEEAATVPPAGCSQPLEEVNPSILNAKGFSPGVGSGGSGTVGYGAGGGKEEGCTPPPPAAAAASSTQTSPQQPQELGGGDGASSSPATVGGDSLRTATEGSMTSAGAAGATAAASAAAAAMPASLVMSDGQDGGDDGGGDRAGALPTPPPARGPADAAAPGTGAVIDRRAGGGAGGASPPADAAAVPPAGGGLMVGSPARGVKPPAAGGGGGGGALEDPGSRLRGKSVEAKGSTGVSPMQKRNRRELKLSEEETAMAGAPQGPVYQVAVLETGEFEPSPNAGEEMRAVLAASGGGGDWADLYSAVDSARRLCIFHAEVVLLGGEGEGEGEASSGSGNLAGVVGLLAMAVGNLRSSMVRNALLGVGDVFSFLKHDAGRVDIRPMVAGTLQRLAGDKRFICQTAAQAMEAATRNGPSLNVLHAILPSLDDRNPEVAAKSAFYSEQCLAALGVGSKAGVGLPEGLEFHRLVPGMSRALNGKVAEGRASSRRALLRSRKAMGLSTFEAAVGASLDRSEASALLAALATPNRAGGASKGGLGGRAPTLHGREGAARGGAAGGGGARPSIREQMMAARRKKEEAERGGERKKGQGGGGGDGFVVVT